MFNKRDHSDSESAQERRVGDMDDKPPAAAKASTPSAVIGPSIHIDGKLRGDEDLVIEGKVKGTVELKKNSVTIGAHGDVQADVYAHTIFIDGAMNGNLVASERVVIRKSARIKGSVVSPRVSLEDGARFNGSIDMDAESEALAKAFSDKKAASTGAGSTPGASRQKAAGGSQQESAKPADRPQGS